jgi:predicted Zn-dependent peptidase
MELDRSVLANGLRVVLDPDPGALAVGVAVAYGVGTRSEPPGRAGFAHLFEHLMFQGSAGLRRSAHARHVERSGGTFNGSTHLDHTMYAQAVPANALERMLYLEADRMRGLRLSEASLANQVAVVKQEISVNVLSRPYGGFPWPRLAAAMFESFANTHDGYGFADLESATLDDAAGFFTQYYSARNAVLCVSGLFDSARAARLVERHFGDVPDRPAPPGTDTAEPETLPARHVVHHDASVPLPALAWGWRVPDPIAEFEDFLPYVLLAGLLDRTRLARRLVFEDRSVTSVTARVGLLGDTFTVRDPTALVVQARLTADADAQKVLAASIEEIETLARYGPDAPELAAVVAGTTTDLLTRTDSVYGRSQRLAVFELHRGDPALLAESPKRLASVGPDRIRHAAASLTAERCASVELRPAGSVR